MTAPELLLFPFLLIIIVYRNRTKIDEGDLEITRKYKYLVENVNVKKSWYAKYFVPVFLIRRLLLMALPVIFYQNFAFQIMFLTFFSMMYIIYYSGVRPTANTQQQYLIELNEVFIMAINYHMMLLSAFVPKAMHFGVGVSLVNVIMLLMMINFSVMGYNMGCRLVDKYVAYKIRKIWEEEI